MFLTGAKDGQLLCPTAGAVFMLLRLAIAATAMHAKKGVRIRAGRGWLPSALPS